MSVSNYRFTHAFTGLLMMWIVYLFFHLGCNRNAKKPIIEISKINTIKYPLYNIAEWSSIRYIIFGSLSILFSFGAAKFYTGRTPISIIQGLFQSNNSYALYQKYAREASIGTLSFSKMPYVFMLVYCFTMLIWGCVGIILSPMKKRIVQWFFVLEVIISVLIFGIARGTNYEMYIVFTCIAFCVFNRKKQENKISFFERNRKIILIALMGVIVVIVFVSVVGSRGMVFSNQICEEIIYDPESIISTSFPLLTTLGLSFFRYLGWGIFSIGIITNNVILNNSLSFISSIIPSGYLFTQDETLDSIVRYTISVGNGWVPDYFAFIDHFGWIIFMILLYLFGRLVASLEDSKYPPLLRNIVGLYVFIEMLSIPVGNFLIISTPLLISALFSFGWCLLYKFRIRIVLRNKREIKDRNHVYH